jgi:hypothetical protein
MVTRIKSGVQTVWLSGVQTVWLSRVLRPQKAGEIYILSSFKHVLVTKFE